MIYDLLQWRTWIKKYHPSHPYIFREPLAYVKDYFNYLDLSGYFLIAATFVFRYPGGDAQWIFGSLAIMINFVGIFKYSVGDRYGRNIPFIIAFIAGMGVGGRARAKGKDSLKHKSFSLSPLFNIILCPMHSCEASVLIYFLLAFEDTSVFT